MNQRELTNELSPGKKVLFSAILLALVLVVLEVGSGLLLRATSGYDGEHLLQYQFDPYKNILPTPNYVDTRGVQHNAQGFRRSTPVQREKPAGTYRIFLMGASTAYGTGGLWPHLQKDFAVLDNTETIDAYLEQELSAAFPGRRFEVINAGIPSTWTHHELIYLNQTVLGYNPDMVLLLDGFNDFFFYNNGHDQFARYAYGEQAHRIMGEPTVLALAAANGWWLYRKSAFAHLLFKTARETKRSLIRGEMPAPIDVPAAVATLEKVYAQNALKMIRRTGLILRDEGIPAVFMLQPLLILERDRPGAPAIEKTLFEFNVKSMPGNYEAFMQQAVPMVASLEERVVKEVGGEFINLTNIFDGKEGQIYTDYAHLTPKGNQALARRVADRIIPIIQGRMQQPD